MYGDDSYFEQIRNSPQVEFSREVFQGMVGREFDFYGAAECQFKLDDCVWEAVEDPDDGYRSHLGCIVAKPETHTVFFKRPIARVRLMEYKGKIKADNNERWGDRDVDFYYLTDVTDGHKWLTIGTDNTDDYYPSFTFHYQPKEAEHGRTVGQ